MCIKNSYFVIDEIEIFLSKSDEIQLMHFLTNKFLLALKLPKDEIKLASDKFGSFVALKSI